MHYEWQAGEAVRHGMGSMALVLYRDRQGDEHSGIKRWRPLSASETPFACCPSTAIRSTTRARRPTSTSPNARCSKPGPWRT